MTNQGSSTVRLMHYDPKWRQEFSQTKSSLLSACEGWLSEVEHIGGTAIPGMISQPTIDLLAGVKSSREIDQAACRIEGLNFLSAELDISSQKAMILTKPRRLLDDQNEATHRVFLTQIGSILWRTSLAVRDYLRRSPEAALQYEEVKMLHWRRTEGDRVQYEASKSSYLTHLIDQIHVERSEDSAGTD